MLAIILITHLLAAFVGAGSVSFYVAAFFYPEVSRPRDIVWSALGLLYAVLLWFCAPQMTAAILLGQLVAVVLLGVLGWQTLSIRREKTPVYQQTPVVITPEVAGNWAKNKINQLRIAPAEPVPLRLEKRSLSEFSDEGLGRPIDPRRRRAYEYEFVEDGLGREFGDDEGSEQLLLSLTDEAVITGEDDVLLSVDVTPSSAIADVISVELPDSEAPKEALLEADLAEPISPNPVSPNSALDETTSDDSETDRATEAESLAAEILPTESLPAEMSDANVTERDAVEPDVTAAVLPDGEVQGEEKLISEAESVVVSDTGESTESQADKKNKAPANAEVRSDSEVQPGSKVPSAQTPIASNRSSTSAPDGNESSGDESDWGESDWGESDWGESDWGEIDRVEEPIENAVAPTASTQTSSDPQKKSTPSKSTLLPKEKPSLLATPIILAGWIKDVVVSFTKPKPAKPVIDIPRRDSAVSRPAASRPAVSRPAASRPAASRPDSSTETPVQNAPNNDAQKDSNPVAKSPISQPVSPISQSVSPESNWDDDPEDAREDSNWDD
ncbi:MAG: Ycf66 family protein [Phormidesmis sp.]